MNEVRLDEFCPKVFGVTGRQYRRIAEAGHAPIPRKGLIPLLEASRDLIAYYRKLGERKGTTFESEKILKLAVERKLKELKLSIQSGDLIPKSDLPHMVLEREKAVERGLRSLHHTLTKKLLGKDARQMSEVIKVQVYRFLKRIGTGKVR